MWATVFAFLFNKGIVRAVLEPVQDLAVGGFRSEFSARQGSVRAAYQGCLQACADAVWRKIRGCIQVTHDYNYLAFRDYVAQQFGYANGSSEYNLRVAPIYGEDLAYYEKSYSLQARIDMTQFSQFVADNYFYTAGLWFWLEKGSEVPPYTVVNQYPGGSETEVYEVTKSVRTQNLSLGDQDVTDRKKAYDKIKQIFPA